MGRIDKVISGEDGAIPWGIYSEREVLRDRCWYEPQGDMRQANVYVDQMKRQGVSPNPSKIIELIHGKKRVLERYVLPNGIHYALIKDPHSSLPVFSDREYQGSEWQGLELHAAYRTPSVIQGTDLGNGHILQMFVTYTADQVRRVAPNAKDNCTSYVKKEIHVPSGAGTDVFHTLSYDVSPYAKTLRLQYEQKQPQAYSSIALRPSIEPDWGDGHEIVFGKATQEGRNDGFIRFEFDQDGTLNYCFVQGKRNILSQQTVRPGVTITYEQTPQSHSFHKKDLSQPDIREYLKYVFGIWYEGELTLDVGRTTNKLLANIDAADPVDSKKLLVFKNSRPIIDPGLNNQLAAF